MRAPFFQIPAVFTGLPRVFWWLWTGSLINRIGGFVVPFMALYLTRERALSPAAAGLVVSTYGLGSALGALAGLLLLARAWARAAADASGRRAP